MRRKRSRREREALNRERRVRRHDQEVDRGVQVDHVAGENMHDVVTHLTRGSDLEPITEELAREMVITGRWTEKMAREALDMARDGWRYNRASNSLQAPPEMELFDDR